VAARLHGIATESGGRDLLLGSHRAVGLCDFLGGRFEDANRHLEQAIALYEKSTFPDRLVIKKTPEYSGVLKNVFSILEQRCCAVGRPIDE
jgi:hypothetical protein